MTRWQLCLIVVVPCLAASIAAPVAGQVEEVVSLDSLLSVPVNAASKRVQQVKDAPASVTIYTADDIARFGWPDLQHLLNSVPGFYSSYDRNYAYIGSRGFGRPSDYNNRVLLLLNGHTLNEGIWGGMTGGSDLAIDLRTLERVEIIRGPGAALYGNSAIFAVINLITRPGAALESARVSGSVGSFGHRQISVEAGRRFASGLDAAASATWGRTNGATLHFREFADDSATGGTVRGLDWEESRGAMFTLKHPNGLSLQGRYAWRGKGIPTGSFGQVFGDPRSASWDESAFLELGWERSLTPALHLSTRAYGDGYWYKGDYAYDELYPEGSEGRVVGGEAALRWDLGSRDRATAGVEYRDNIRALYEYPRGDHPEIRLDRPYTVVSAYLQNEIDLTRWLTVVGGLRYDRHSRSGAHLSPRLAAVINPDHVTSLKLLYGSAFRAPSVAERDYVLEGAKLSVGLEPEQIRTLEIALERQVVRGVVVNASAYYYDMERLIDLLFDPADSLTQFRNGAEVHAHGFELGVEGRVASGLRGGLSWSYARARDGDGVPLTNSPQNILRGFSLLPLTSAASVAFEARYETGRRTLSGGSTSNFFLANTNLRWAPVRSRLDASLRISNLFDASYTSPAGPEHLQSVIQQDGRTFLLSMGARF